MIQGRYDAGPVDETSLKHLTRVLVCLSAGFVISMVMLAGSSFVEEEHQTWQFFTASFCTALFVGLLRNALHSSPKPVSEAPKNVLFDAQLSLGDDSLRFRKDLCVKSKTWQIIDGYANDEYTKNGSPYENTDGSKSCNGTSSPVLSLEVAKDPSVWKMLNRKPFYLAGFCLLAHRWLKSWNQTGVKRINEPDIGE